MLAILHAALIAFALQSSPDGSPAPQAPLQGAEECLARARAAHEKHELEPERRELARAIQLLLDANGAEGNPECSDRLLAVARSADAAGDSSSAARALEAVVRFRERTLPDDDAGLQMARMGLAFMRLRLGNAKFARELFEKVLAVREKTLKDDDGELQITRLDLAEALRALQDFEGARTLDEKVLSIFERTLPEDDHRLQMARTNLAGVLLRLGRTEEARVLEDKALAIEERTLPDDDPALQSARLVHAGTLASLGDLRGALALEQKVLAVREHALPEDHAELQNARQAVSNSLASLGDLHGAQKLQEKVLAVRLRTMPADSPAVQAARVNLGTTLFLLGELQSARSLYEAALAVYDKTLPEDSPDLQGTRGNMALVLRNLGDLREARALLERALAGMEKALPADDRNVLGTRLNLASVVKAMGDWAAARVLEEKVVDVLESRFPEDYPDLLMARMNLAGTLILQGDLAGARTLLEGVLAVREKTLSEDSSVLLETRVNLAATLFALGDPAAARAEFQKVIPIYERTVPDDHAALLAARLDLCWALLALEDNAPIPPLIDASARTVRNSLGRSFTASAREAGERSETSGEMLSHLLSLTDLVPVQATTRDLLFALVETARCVGATNDARTPSSNGEELVALREQADRARTQLHDLVTSAQERRPSPEEIATLARERDRSESRLRARLVELGSAPPDIEVARLAAALPPQARAVGIRRYKRGHVRPGASQSLEGETCLLAHVVDPQGHLVRVELGPAAAIQAAVTAWRAAIGKPLERGVAVTNAANGADEERARGADLRRLVLGPILAATKDATELFVCTDDALNLVPLDALPLDALPLEAKGAAQGASAPSQPSGGSQALLGQRTTIHVETSFARLLVPARNIPQGSPALLALGGIDYNAGEAATPKPALVAAAEAGSSHERAGPLGTNWGLLPGTRGEAEGIGALFHDVFHREALVILGGQATKSALEEHISGARFVHIATHGYFAPQSIKSLADDIAPDASRLWTPMSLEDTVTGMAPMTLCGLALAGANRGMDALGHVSGILTAEELSGLDLSGCELAVLSACETNCGIARAGQGIQSLQAALHAAGARTVITSLWKVDDQATRELFEDFYTRIWVEKKPKAKALWDAKMALRKSGHPTRDWAAWVLTGDPN
jgi:tetratricopeptide (TPR) repeat protein